MIAYELLAGADLASDTPPRVGAAALFQLLASRGWAGYFDALQAAQLGIAGYWFLANSGLEPCLIQSGAVLKHWIDGLQLQRAPDHTLIIDHADPELAAFGCALLWRLHSQAASRKMPLLQIEAPELSSAAAEYLAGQSESYCEVANRRGLSLKVGEAAWQAPYVTQNRQLLPLLSDSLAFLQKQDDSTAAGRVYQHLESLDQLIDISQSQVATALAVSDRTLSRQLADEGSSFRELLTRQRNARAIAGLCQGDPIDALALVLGFSERAAFERAFKSWQGVTPAKFQAQYRRLSQEVDIERLIAPEHLPTLPAIAGELLAMAQNEDASLDDMARLVERDPVLTAKLLNIACSAYYGLPPGTRIRDAVIRVFGVDRLRYLALSMLAAGGFSTSHCPAFNMGHFWLVSLAVAQLAVDCLKVSGAAAEQQADIYLAGLLHTIGRLVLVQCFPGKMQSLLSQLDLAPAPQEMLAMEKLRLGVDASEAGALLVAKWQLPRSVSVFMRQLATAKGAQNLEASLILTLHEYVLACVGCDPERRSLAVDLLQQTLSVERVKLERTLEDFETKLPELQTVANAI